MFTNVYMYHTLLLLAPRVWLDTLLCGLSQLRSADGKHRCSVYWLEVVTQASTLSMCILTASSQAGVVHVQWTHGYSAWHCSYCWSTLLRFAKSLQQEHSTSEAAHGVSHVVLTPSQTAKTVVRMLLYRAHYSHETAMYYYDSYSKSTRYCVYYCHHVIILLLVTSVYSNSA
jgi:hypothetical protein